MISYRTFRNYDPPKIVDLWNACVAGHRALFLRGATLLEYFILAKPCFDPAGLHLALDGSQLVGLSLASAATGEHGAISVVAVHPNFRRQGVGSRLLQLAEQYLHEKGARRASIGEASLAEPFLLGLYGGCASPGILEDTHEARPFLEKNGYSVRESHVILRKSLPRLSPPSDPRFAAIHPGHEVLAGPARNQGRMRECALGPVEAAEMCLRRKSDGAILARLLLWDMEPFHTGTGHPCVGLLDLQVSESHRRQGFAKFLLTTALLYLRERSYQAVEALAGSQCPAGRGLAKALGFEQASSGVTMSKELAS